MFSHIELGGEMTTTEPNDLGTEAELTELIRLCHKFQGSRELSKLCRQLHQDLQYAMKHHEFTIQTEHKRQELLAFLKIGYAPWMNDFQRFFHIAFNHRLDQLVPSLTQFRSETPLGTEDFDWSSFTVVLLAVEREAERRLASARDDSRKSSQVTDANQDRGPTWPKGLGWEFQPGEAAFLGTRFRITGKPNIVLRKLAETPGVPVRKSVFLSLIDPNSDANEECVRDAISMARGILRDQFNLRNSDPIPNVERGKDGAWMLDEKVFSHATTNPR